MLSRQPDSPEEALTKGAFVVTEILAWNDATNEIFYLANTVNDSSVQHLYSVSVNSKETKCLSCGVKSTYNQTDCLYNVAEFSEDASYYVLTCAGPDVPDVTVYSLEKGKILDWEQNQHLRKFKNNTRIPVVKKMSFEVDGGFTAQVSLKLPPNMDTSGNTKYPMLVNVYELLHLIYFFGITTFI